MDTCKEEESMVCSKAEKSTPESRDATVMIKEGKVEIMFPNTNAVFYNPVQEFNRDLSVAVLRRFTKEYVQKARSATKMFSVIQSESTMEQLPNEKSEGITILEALSASGLRAIRYATEVPGVSRIVANDVSINAVETIRKNVEHNKVQQVVEVSHADAAIYMYEHRQHNTRFNVVDLDPYGSAAAFLDAGVQAVSDGGLLMVTCTDLAILCGNCSEKCHANYGAMSVKSHFCHEMALRIVLQSIESHANRYGRYIQPLLSVSVDFYVRIFVKVFSGHAAVKHSASKLAMVYLCTGCEAFTLQPIGRCTPNEKTNSFKFSNSFGPTVDPLCKHCGNQHQLGGPIWSKEIHDTNFVEGVMTDLDSYAEVLNTSDRIRGILSLVSEELPDAPFFYMLDKLSSVVHTRCPKMNGFRSALLNAGYKVSYSHVRPQSIKTDAPAEVIWDIMRHWVKLNPVTRQLTDNDVAKIILDKEPRTSISFQHHPKAEPESKKSNLLRYQMNPQKYWGPKARAKTSPQYENEYVKSKRLQGKHVRHSDSNDLKQFPCKRFKKGECILGDDCKYSHQDPANKESTDEIK